MKTPPFSKTVPDSLTGPDSSDRRINGPNKDQGNKDQGNKNRPVTNSPIKNRPVKNRPIKNRPVKNDRDGRASDNPGATVYRHLPVSVQEKLRLYHDMLMDYQRRFNLIGAGSIAHAWADHFLDSLALIPYLPPPPPPPGKTEKTEKTEERESQFGVASPSALGPVDIVDLGSGAGFPGMVLAIACRRRVDLIESRRPKCQFLRDVARCTDAPVLVHHSRIETCALSNAPHGFDPRTDVPDSNFRSSDSSADSRPDQQQGEHRAIGSPPPPPMEKEGRQQGEHSADFSADSRSDQQQGEHRALGSPPPPTEKEAPPIRAKVITARALARLDRLNTAAMRFWAEDTVCLFPKGRDIEAEIAAARRRWAMQCDILAARRGCVLRITALGRKK